MEFQPGVDLDAAASEVREAVSRVTRELPDEVEQVAVFKADEDAEEIVQVAVMSDYYGEAELTRIVEQDIVPQLIALKGVADVPLGTRARSAGDHRSVATHQLWPHGDRRCGPPPGALDVPAGSFGPSTRS